MNFHLLPRHAWPVLLSTVMLLGTAGIAPAEIITKIENTKHNLSASGPGTVKATSENQVCVFCHTPHKANATVNPPLWNRELSSMTYTPYTSSSMDAVTNQPGGSSKLCLSCHDGTLAIGTVGVLNNSGPVTISMEGTNAGNMPAGAGELTGYTRDLGVDLSNDHPISLTYDATLASNDGELRTPPVMEGSAPVVDNRTPGVFPRPFFPLDNNQVQCTTCHDPHTWESNPAKGNHKFLRGNRLQQAQPLGGPFVQQFDNICLACHDKAGTLWAYSAHANHLVTDQILYLDSAAAQRDFPANTPVWKAACLNCHDTHTVQGAKRLLREGTDSPVSPKSAGNPATEETCYQCHSDFGTSIIEPLTTVTDIKKDFSLPIHMPISRQPETHDIGGSFDDSIIGGIFARCNTSGSKCGKDGLESEAVLGKVSTGGLISNRHAECTDCHNPHRVTKNRLFNDDPSFPAVAGTHKHTITAGDSVIHDNLASGSLRGTFGVEPQYLSAEFGAHPFSYVVKRGDGANFAPTTVSSTYVTREYQICLKCHSPYAYDETDPTALALGYSGGTLSGTNGFLYFTDIAMEFQAPVTHKGTPASTTDSGASSPAFSTNNHRSWHPVMDNTGRTNLLPGSADPNTWRTPWNGSDTDGPTATTLVSAVGNQTMYCSDCHGSSTDPAEGVVPVGGENGNSWGPHGSTENFLLKGAWNTGTAHTIGSNTLCFLCHDENQYADASGAPASRLNSGFGGIGSDHWSQPVNNLHQRHAFYTTQGGTMVPILNTPVKWPASENGTYRCTMCHTGTSHGWKNKAFLVNLYDLGPEITAIGGETASGSPLSPGQPVPKGTQVTATIPDGYSNGPYYRGALLGVVTFRQGGNWSKNDCQGACH
ncbi:MAG: cytochrome c3 family protein [Gallionella sp.]